MVFRHILPFFHYRFSSNCARKLSIVEVLVEEMGRCIISEEIIINTYLINSVLWLKKCFPSLWLLFLNMWENNPIAFLLFCEAKPNRLFLVFWFSGFLVWIFFFQKGLFFPMSILVALPCICSQFNSQFLNMDDRTAHIADVVLPVCYTDRDTHSRQLHLRELLEKCHHFYLISFVMSTNLWCYLCLSKVGYFFRDRKWLTVLEIIF